MRKSARRTCKATKRTIRFYQSRLKEAESDWRWDDREHDAPNRREIEHWDQALREFVTGKEDWRR